LNYWFAPPAEDEERPSGKELWFTKSAKTDRTIERKFGRLVDKAKAGTLDGWASTARGRLALIILLDQFNRNINRDSKEMYDGDAKALALCLDGLDEGMDQELLTLERAFFYMPCVHAEDVDAQMAGVEVFTELRDQASPEQRAVCEDFLKHAEQHRDIVERFERFPHRNAILDRQSTPEESAWLQQSGNL